jgi:hypothetical protein
MTVSSLSTLMHVAGLEWELSNPNPANIDDAGLNLSRQGMRLSLFWHA